MNVEQEVCRIEAPSLCCPTKEICGNSTGIEELTVDDFLANVGIGIVLLF